MGEPGILPLGVAPRRLLPSRDCLVERDCPFEIGSDLADSNPTHDRELRIQCPIKEPGHFFDRALLDHAGKSVVTAIIEPLAWWQQDDGTKGDFVGNPTLPLSMPFSCRAAGRQQHLQGTCNPQAVGAVQPAGRFGIKSFKLGAICCDGRCADLAADFWVDRWDGCNAVDQGTKVKTGAANQDREPTRSVDISNLASSASRPVRCRA